MIEVEHLSKRYGRIEALKGMSFKAEGGQIVGFLGANGAGKTTTMRILAGYMPPSGGRAVVAGYDVFEQSMAVRERVGYLPESVPLYRDMTVWGYLAYLAEIRRLAHGQERVGAIIAQVGLEERAHSRIRTLSKGMRQRVGLASALIHQPPVLILDEPTIGLDPLQVLELRALVRDLRSAHTILFSTHILSEAEQLCDTIIILNQGAVIAQGTPAELRHQLQGGGRVLVRVGHGGMEPAYTVISALPHVAHVGMRADALFITPDYGRVTQDVLSADMVRALVGAGIEVLEIRPVAVTLEDMFIELVAR